MCKTIVSFVVIIFLTLLIIAQAFALEEIKTIDVEKKKSWIKEFFSIVPKPDPSKIEQAATQGEWKWRPIVTLPALKITESTRPDAKADVFLLTSAGGGISYQRLIYNSGTEKWECKFSWSPLTILLSGNLTAAKPIDISLATTIGIFNNLIMYGLGIDLGEVQGRSRIFGLLSIGININN